MNYLLTLVVILGISMLMGKVVTRLRLPAVVGQLLGGVVVGPSILNWVQPNSFISTLAELGVVILMFIAGLSSDLHLLKLYLKPSLVVAVLGILVPVVSIYLLCRVHALSLATSLFIGVVFAATSVSISVVVLKENHALNTSAGMTILGAAVADDILSILLLGSVSTMLGLDPHNKSNLAVVLLMQGCFLIVIWGLLYAVTHWNLHWKALPDYGVLSGGIIWALLLAGLAESVQLSAVTGAFFAGMLVGQTPFKTVLNSRISTWGEIFLIPIFFVNVGLNMQLMGIVQQWPFFLALTELAVVTKFLGAYCGSRCFQFTWNEASTVGVGMISRGEVGLIVAEIGLKSHLIPSDYYASIVAAIIVTTIVAPLLLQFLIKDRHKYNLR
jgi:Kef-type K+ transport system membrane component KefB